jgi:hypothetical protein
MGTATAMRRRHRAEQRFPPTATAPRRARRFIRQALSHAGIRRKGLPAELLTSEVVTDAVSHSPAEISVRVVVDPDVVRVEVSEEPDLVVDIAGESVRRQTARQLVDALATRWDSDLDRDRTTTWFELTTGDSTAR